MLCYYTVINILFHAYFVTSSSMHANYHTQGPLINQAAIDKITMLLDDATKYGAKVLCYVLYSAFCCYHNTVADISVIMLKSLAE